MAERDWYDWHAPYGDPSSGLSLRLSWVQERIWAALDEAPPGPIRLISMCAGQGHDVLGALPGHPRRGDVTARLVELDPRNTEAVPQACAWFEDRGFERVWVSDPGYKPCCGAHRFTAAPALLEPGATMFTFRPFRAPGQSTAPV
jgi:hypothetical protein